MVLCWLQFVPKAWDGTLLAMMYSQSLNGTLLVTISSQSLVWYSVGYNFFPQPGRYQYSVGYNLFPEPGIVLLSNSFL